MLKELLFPRIKLADIAILKGKVSNLKFMSHIIGGNESVSTGFIATFEIDSRMVVLNSSEPLFIDAGDEIIISGFFEQGIFKSAFYYNFTNKIYNTSRLGGILTCFLGSIFFGVATLLTLFLYDFFPLILFWSIFGLAGYRLYHSGKLALRACDLIITEATQALH